MSREQISGSIALLRDEIENLGADSAAAKLRLESLVAALETQLAESESGSESTSKLNDSVGELIGHFEVEHPRITGILNDLMVTLGGMGI